MPQRGNVTNIVRSAMYSEVSANLSPEGALAYPI